MAKKNKNTKNTKTTKEQKKLEKKRNTYDNLTHPTQKWWGKAVSIILIFGFMGLLLFSLIYLIIHQLG